jgi:hypothetical protein
MIKLNISSGDFCDRYTITDLKYKKGKVSKEIRDYYESVYDRFLGDNVNNKGGPFVIAFLKNIEGLAEINSKLWEVEDLIRNSQTTVEWASRAQRVIELNDLRAKLKKSIDEMFNDASDSKIYTGQKSYSI